MLTNEVIKALRARALASDARAGSWSRNKARREQHRFLRQNWMRLLAVGLVMLTSVLVVVILMPTAFTRGLALGGGLASTGGAVAFWVLQITGTAPAMMGGQGEQWTASELRPLQRRGWRVVHHVSLRTWDIDHVLIGPGGAFAIETKWSAQPWVLEPAEERVLKASRQAAGNARDLRLWDSFRKAGIDVQPVVMLWGPGLRSRGALEAVVPLDDAVVVSGPFAARWRDNLPAGVLTDEQIDAGWWALEKQVRLRDDLDLEAAPKSVGQLATATIATVIAAAAGVVLAASLITLVRPLWLWLLACAASALLPLPLRHWEPARLPLLAWQTGLIGVVLVAGAGTALTRLI